MGAWRCGTGTTHHVFVSDRLTQAEVKVRFERNVQRKLRLAHFPFFKTLDQFNFTFQPLVNERQLRDLLSLRFVANAENVLFLGPLVWARPIWQSVWAWLPSLTVYILRVGTSTPLLERV